MVYSFLNKKDTFKSNNKNIYIGDILKKGIWNKYYFKDLKLIFKSDKKVRANHIMKMSKEKSSGMKHLSNLKVTNRGNISNGEWKYCSLKVSPRGENKVVSTTKTRNKY